ARLESVYTRNRIVGSNPTLTATFDTEKPWKLKSFQGFFVCVPITCGRLGKRTSDGSWSPDRYADATGEDSPRTTGETHARTRWFRSSQATEPTPRWAAAAGAYSKWPVPDAACPPAW